jgi:hypothetical protein
MRLTTDARLTSGVLESEPHFERNVQPLEIDNVFNTAKEGLIRLKECHLSHFVFLGQTQNLQGFDPNRISWHIP